MNMEWKPPSFHLLPYMVIKNLKIKEKNLMSVVEGCLPLL
jgi:hypothetical protein